MDCYNTVAIVYNLKRPIFFSLQPQIRNQQVKQGLSLDQPGSGSVAVVVTNPEKDNARSYMSAMEKEYGSGSWSREEKDASRSDGIIDHACHG